jgi:3-hydroxybutyryl-CoA dehydratase
VGDTISLGRTLTQTDVETFAELSLDHNPLHLDPAFGKTSFYGHNVAHGLLGAALISGALTELCGAGNLWINTELEFKRPIVAGGELECNATVQRFDARRREASIEVMVYQGDQVVITGTARCLVPYTAALEAP